MVGLVSLAGCEGETVGTFSCTFGAQSADGGAPALASCNEVSGGSTSYLEISRAGCNTQHGVFATAPCSHENTMGGCRRSGGGVISTTWFYLDSNGAPDATEIEAACTQGGMAFVTPDQNH